MLFYLLLIAASPILITAFQQNSDAAKIAARDELDGSGFDDGSGSDDGSASGQSNEKKPIIANCDSDYTFDECLHTCPITLIVDPLCGTDNEDYINESIMQCAQCCGKDIAIKHYGRCKMDGTDKMN